MKSNRKLHALLAMSVFAASIGLGGCVAAVRSDPYYHRPYYVEYDYYYYPTVDIYFDIAAGYYWYRDHDHWKYVKRLPSYYRLHDNDRVFLRLDTDRPYKYYEQHRERYHRPPPRHDQERRDYRDRDRDPRSDKGRTQEWGWERPKESRPDAYPRQTPRIEHRDDVREREYKGRNDEPSNRKRDERRSDVEKQDDPKRQDTGPDNRNVKKTRENNPKEERRPTGKPEDSIPEEEEQDGYRQQWEGIERSPAYRRY